MTRFIGWEGLSPKDQAKHGDRAGYQRYIQETNRRLYGGGNKTLSDYRPSGRQIMPDIRLFDPYRGAGPRPVKGGIRTNKYPEKMPRGQVGQFTPYNPNQIYMTSPDIQLMDGPAPQLFNTHTGAISQAAGRGGLGGGTWNIGDEGYQALIDKYNTNNPQGAPLTSLAGVSGQMSGIASQLGDYGPQMSDLQSQFGTRGETISGMQEQIGGFGDQFSKINEGIGGLTSQYGDMNKMLSSFQDQTAQFSGDIHNQIGQIGQRVDHLENRVGASSGGYQNPFYSGSFGSSAQPSYMPLNFGTGLNMPNSGSYPSSAYYGGISPFMFGFY